MADQRQKLEDSTSCPICLELLKNPTTLRCGHSLCLEHIAQLRKPIPNSHAFEVQCPYCTQKFLYDSELSPNITLRDMVAILFGGQNGGGTSVQHAEESQKQKQPAKKKKKKSLKMECGDPKPWLLYNCILLLRDISCL